MFGLDIHILFLLYRSARSIAHFDVIHYHKYNSTHYNLVRVVGLFMTVWQLEENALMAIRSLEMIGVLHFDIRELETRK